MTSARLGSLVKFMDDVLTAAASALREYQATRAEVSGPLADAERWMTEFGPPWQASTLIGADLMRRIVERGPLFDNKQAATEWGHSAGYTCALRIVLRVSPELADLVTARKIPPDTAIRIARRYYDRSAWLPRPRTPKPRPAPLPPA